jgi:hypothetical protein
MMRERLSIPRPVEEADGRSRNHMAPSRYRAQSRIPHRDARLVLRRCRVCEWQDKVLEVTGADPDCPWCHGPTEAGQEIPVVDDDDGAGKNPHAAALGRLGGLKGGRARAQTLSAKQRREIASKAARARWNKR